MARMDLTRSTLAAAALAALAGCATPILKIQGPGYSVADSPAPTDEPDDMVAAQQKLNQVRAQYYEAIRNQSQTSTNATTGFVWLGSILLGSAYGTVSKDWITGTALAGGTAYGLTRTQLDARNIKIWQQGIEALDCARAASLPLDIGQDRQATLRDAVVQLVAARDEVQARAADLQAAVDKLGRSKLKFPEDADQALHRADDAQAAADKAVASAQVFLDATRGRELSNTVDKVSSQVTKALSDIAVDVSSVKALVSGLGGFASTFVPGIDATFGHAFDRLALVQGTGITANGLTGKEAKKAKKAPPPPAEDPELKAASTRLADAASVLAKRQATVKALVSTADTSAVQAALKDCSVAAAAGELTLQPASLDFTEKTADLGRGVQITGGTPPYEVRLLDAVGSDSIAVVFSGGLSDSLVVKAGANTAAGTYTVSVKDNSTSHHAVTLPVHVNAAAAAPSPSPAAQARKQPAVSGAASSPAAPPAAGDLKAAAPPADIQALWAQLSKAIGAAPPTVFSNATVNVTKAAPLSTGGVVVDIHCSAPIDPSPPAQQRIKDALVLRDSATYNLLLKAGAADRTGKQIQLRPDIGCAGK